MSNHVKHLFWDWRDHKGALKEEVDRHLGDCENCRLYYDKMSQLVDPELLSSLPKLIPDPYVPTRIKALAVERDKARAILLFSRLRLSMESLAFILAVITGILIGKTFITQEPETKKEDVISAYKSAVSPDDFSTRMESILESSEGGKQ